MKKLKVFIILLLVIALGIISFQIINARLLEKNEILEDKNEATPTNTDTSKKTEQTSNLKEYKTNNYTIKYKADWNLLPEVDANRVGPNSSYIGALELAIPSTTNSEYTSSIYVKVTDENTTTEDLAEKLRKDNKNEYFVEKSSSEIKLKNQNAYTIIAETTDGIEGYIKQDVLTVVNGKSYKITFFASEKEYSNLKDEINEFFENFEITE